VHSDGHWSLRCWACADEQELWILAESVGHRTRTRAKQPGPSTSFR
jgi:hypothetical protein